MKVWYAAFQLSQERLITLFFTAVGMGWLGSMIERFAGLAILPAALAVVPSFWDIANPLLRIAILALALWLVLTITFTIKIRLDIRRDNYVRPKQ